MRMSSPSKATKRTRKNPSPKEVVACEVPRSKPKGLEPILDHLEEGVYVLDKNNRISYWNCAMQQISGYRASEVLGKFCQSLHFECNPMSRSCKKHDCSLSHALKTGRAQEGEAHFRHREGYRIPIRLRAIPLEKVNGRVARVAAVCSDISEKVSLLHQIEELKKQALIDSLTSLGNRGYTVMVMQRRIEELKRYGWPFGVLFIDIDNFKHINDTYGHPSGDRVLRTIAKTLLRNSRSADFVGRWGGEEIITVHTKVTLEQLLAIADKFRSLVAGTTVAIGHERISLTVSIGATLATDKDTIESLVQRADGLMYQSKLAGRNRVSY